MRRFARCLPHGIVDFRDVIGMNDRMSLVAATSLAAESCGLGHRKGRLASGYDADVLVVTGDAAADVSALRRPLAIYRAGALVT